MSPQRQKIEFEPNIPVTMTLEFDGGKAVPARNGVQYLYWVDGQRSAFLDPPAHEQIQASGAKAGDTLEITKTLKGRAIGWEVVHIVDEPTHHPPAAAEPIHPPPPPPIPRQQHAVTPTTVSLLSAFCATIDALSEAAAYAKRKGLDMTITSEMIRTTAISVYIGSEKGCAR